MPSISTVERALTIAAWRLSASGGLQQRAGTRPAPRIGPCAAPGKGPAGGGGAAGRGLVYIFRPSSSERANATSVRQLKSSRFSGVTTAVPVFMIGGRLPRSSRAQPTAQGR